MIRYLWRRLPSLVGEGYLCTVSNRILVNGYGGRCRVRLVVGGRSGGRVGRMEEMGLGERLGVRSGGWLIIRRLGLG